MAGAIRAGSAGLLGGAVWLTAPAPAAAAPIFVSLDFVPVALSDDGSTAVGYTVFGVIDTIFRAVRWTREQGTQELGDLPGGRVESRASAVSADGSVVVGYSAAAAGTLAFRWTAAEGMVALGDLPGGGGSPLSRALDVSADGSVVVGESISSSGYEAFRWSEASGMLGLGDFEGSIFQSRATGVSADGSVVTGTGSRLLAERDIHEAFRWTGAGGLEGIGTLGPGLSSTGLRISNDGAAIAGASGLHELYRWTSATGWLPLGMRQNDASESFHRASVSGDGAVVAGVCSFRVGCLWDAANGTRELKQVLGDAGIELSGWDSAVATGLSLDGTALVGYGSRGSWYAVVPEPAAGALLAAGLAALCALPRRLRCGSRPRAPGAAIALRRG